MFPVNGGLARAIAVILLCAGIFCLSQSRAQVPMTGAGLGAPGGAAPSFQGSGDIVSGALVYWSCARAYTASYASGAGNACDIVRTDLTTCTLKFASSGFLDTTTTYCNSNTQTVTQFCNSTTCNVTKAYDQSGALDCGGSACNGTPTSTKPGLNLSALSSYACMTFAGGATNLTAPATNNAHSQPISYSMVANHTTGAIGTVIGSNAGTVQFLFNTGPNQGGIYAGNFAGNVSVTMSDGSYHALQGVANTTSSIVDVDGTVTTGLSAGSGTIAANDGYTFGAGTQAYTGTICEGRIDPIAYNATQYGNLNTNQHSATSGYNF